MNDRELVEQAAHPVLFRRQEDETKTPTLDEGPDGLELRFGDEYLLVLIPSDRTTTVEVKRATTGVLVGTASAEARDYETLATELEEIYERHAGPDA
jgi:hypothetical protein